MVPREQIQAHGLSFTGYREQIAGEMTNLRLRDREAREKVTVTEAEDGNRAAAVVSIHTRHR